MKSLLVTCFSIVWLFSLNAQVRLPAAAPTQYIQQEFGLGNIAVTYSRPAARGHKVFGDLVPYEKLWLTGANTVAKISFSEPVEINGRRIDSGTYALYTVPGLESWEIIFNKGTRNNGNVGYKESEDVLRFKIYAIKTRTKVESFTIQFADVKPEHCELQLLWEKKLVAIPIGALLRDKLRSQLDAAMQTSQKPYWQAAQFYYEYDKNLGKALDNVNKATQLNPQAYWMFLYKAKIQQEMGDAKGALESSNTSLALSKNANNEDYVRMNERLQKNIVVK